MKNLALFTVGLVAFSVAAVTKKKGKIEQSSVTVTLIGVLKGCRRNDLVMIDLPNVVFCYVNHILNLNNKKMLNQILSKYNKSDKEKVIELFASAELKVVDLELVTELRRVIRVSKTLAIARGKADYLIAARKINLVFFDSRRDDNPWFHSRNVRFIEGIAIFKTSNYKLSDEFVECFKEAAPKRVIMISADRRFLEYIKQLCEELNIEFIGFEYTKVVNEEKMKYDEVENCVKILINGKAKRGNNHVNRY